MQSNATHLKQFKLLNKFWAQHIDTGGKLLSNLRIPTKLSAISMSKHVQYTCTQDVCQRNCGKAALGHDRAP